MAIELNFTDKPKSETEQNDWHTVHQQQIAAYNAWAEQRPTFSAEVLAWRESLKSERSA